MPSWRRRRADGPDGPAVELTDEVLLVRRPGAVESIAWEDIAMIAALGEGGEVYLAFSDVEQTVGCVVPRGQAPAELLEWAEALPGFDHDALAGVGETTATVWVRP